VILELDSDSPDATRRLGSQLARALPAGIVIGLVGPLGAGKTQFVKGLVEGIGFDPRNVTSPTFTLIQEYSGRPRIFHVDVYRLGPSPNLRSLGCDEMLGPDAIVVVEWADRVAEQLPRETVWVEFTLTGDTHRQIHFRASEFRLVEWLKTGFSQC
jgi:tRNA threonylcarbamoyladenosine biosynthesis protein TsaE